MIKDTNFITSDPGHKKVDEPRGEKYKLVEVKMEHGPKKEQNHLFGYKLHTKMDIEYQLIRDYKTTTISLHDSQIDLIKDGEVNYRDKGYFDAECAGFDVVMKRAVRGYSLTIMIKGAIREYHGKRSPGERPYAVLKSIFHVGHTLLTIVKRVNVKNMFLCFDFNLLQLRTLKKLGRLA